MKIVDNKIELENDLELTIMCKRLYEGSHWHPSMMNEPYVKTSVEYKDRIKTAEEWEREILMWETFHNYNKG
jgi:hypothetical protein